MKNGLNKFAKGMFAIFTIKLLFFGIMFLNQSCSNNDNLENEEQKIALSKFENLVLESTPKIEKLVNDKNTLSKVNEIERAKEVMLPLVKGAVELLKSYEISNKDIIADFNNVEDPRIALIGLAILESKSKQQNTTASINFENIFIASTYAQEGDLGYCAGRAVGIHAFGDILAGRVGRSAILGALKKVASRTLGWIGLGLAVYDFGDCMGYW